MKKLFFIAFVFTLTLSSCRKDPATTCDNTCPKNMVCTELFAFIDVHVQTTTGEPVTLDTFVTKRVEDGKIINVGRYSWQADGSYPLFSDSQMDLTDKCGKQFYFIGYRANKEVVRAKYTIGHDCCHIKLLEGNTTITK